MAGLRRHVPELALDWMRSEPERRHRSIAGTLCFADVSGFTALAERLAQRGRAGGEELVETLGRVFGAMLDLARERGGALLKFGGDALLLFFEGEDHAVRAAGCAVEMQRALRRAAKTPTSVGPLRLSMSVGLHSGAVDFFLVGGAHRELVVLGSAATKVVATESAANAREIAVSAGTAALLPSDAVRPREDGELLLRWRKGPPAAQPLVERPIDEALVRELFPRALGEYLAPGPPEPEHRVACIAFVRFAGTDALLERSGADAVASALDATLATIQRGFDEEGVTLLAVDIDRDGGKVFAAAGAPHASEDDEGAMLRALRRIHALGTPLPLQMGVNRGHVFVAEVGTPRRAAYSAMGDTTNTAARIAAKAPPGVLYAHPAVLDYSLTLFDVEPAGPFVLKGKKAPQLVYSVGHERGVRSREGIAAFAFVGREAESDALAKALSDLAGGVGGVISILGASGVGKTRLLREALAHTTPGALVELRSEPYGAASPYRMFRDPLRALLGIERGEPGAMRAALERGVAKVAPLLSPWLALLGDVAQVDVPASAEVVALDPRFRTERTADVVIELLDRVHPGPLAIVAEDAHWADEASSQLLARIARECSERPWLLLAARRGVSGGFRCAEGTRELRLDPLSDAAIEALLIAASEAAPLRPHELELLVRRAGGNPLFALEGLRTAREVGSLEAVPESLEAALAAQVDALDPAARRVLRHASVLGRSFARRLLSEILGAEVEPTTLARLEAFLEPDGTERLRFRNDLVRDTTYAGLAYRARARLHRAAGMALEQLVSGDPGASADSLALHFSLAGDDARTWRYARLAGERARRACANADAARLFELALEAGRALGEASDAERVALCRELGEVCQLAGMFERSLEAYRRAARYVGADPLARAELLLGQARVRDREGKLSLALRELTIGSRMVERLRSTASAKLQARLRSFAAMMLWGQERARAALRRAQEAADLARQADEPAALAGALTVIDLAQLAIRGPGNPTSLREALSIYESLGDVRMQALARSNLGVIAAFGGRWNEAVEWFNTARAAYLRCGDAVGAAFPTLNLGEMLAKQGKFSDAETPLRDALRVLRASNFLEGAAAVEIQLSRIAIERAEFASAEATLGRVSQDLLRMGKTVVNLEAASIRAMGLLAGGEAGAALRVLDDATRAAGKEAHLARPTVAISRARALLEVGRDEEAQVEIQEGLEAAQAQGLPYEEALLRRLRVSAALRQNRAPEVADAEAAEEILRGLGVERLPHCLEVVQSPRR